MDERQENLHLLRRKPPAPPGPDESAPEELTTSQMDGRYSVVRPAT